MADLRARVQRAVRHVDGGGEVEPAGKLRRDAQRVGRGRGTVFAHCLIERVRLVELVNQIRGRPGGAGGDRRGERRVIERGLDQPLELRDELPHVLRREIEREEFDGDGAIARLVVRAKHRSPRPRPNLMKNAKRSERGRKPGANSFRAQ